MSVAGSDVGAGALQPSGAHRGFYVMAVGEIESGQFPGRDRLWCNYNFVYGDDWHILQGVNNGSSQTSIKSGGEDALAVWNFPLEVTFKSTNASGWPRLVVSVHSFDPCHCKMRVCGYGSILLPTTPGRHVRYIRNFTPIASNPLKQFLGWLPFVGYGPPEFVYKDFVAGGEGRSVTRVASSGAVKVVLNITTRGMEDLGFAVGRTAPSGAT